MESLQNLSSETVSNLEDLVEVSLDSARGFEQAAESIDDASIADLFRTCAAERRRHVQALRRFVPGEDEPAGSVRGTVHRWWLKIRGAVSSGDEYVVLAEAERGEDAIKGRYEQILKDNPGTPLNRVMQDLYREVKARHDQIRDLRDARKE